MNKAELLALGLPEELVREFQKIYNRDLDRRARKMIERKEPDELREAIVSTLSVIEDPERLRSIMATVTRHYLKEYQGKKEEPSGATNTDQLKVEQKSDQLQSSALSLPKDEGKCQE